MSVVRRTITAGTFLAFLAFLVPGTASADVGVPIPAMGDNEVLDHSGSFAEAGTAGTFDINASSNDGDAAYAAEGVFAGDDGAGTFEVAAATDDADSAYAAEGVFAGHNGAGTFEVAAATDDADSAYAAEGVVAGHDGASTYDALTAAPGTPVKLAMPVYMPQVLDAEISDAPADDLNASYQSSSAAGPNGAATYTAASAVDDDAAVSHVQSSAANINGAATHLAGGVSDDD